MNDAKQPAAAVQENEDVVRVLFQASKLGFGPYDIVTNPQEHIARAKTKTSRYRRKVQQQLLFSLDPNPTTTFVTDLDNTFPHQLQNLVTEEDYRVKMEELKMVLNRHKGPTLPLIAFVVFFFTSIILDVIWQWFNFFTMILPPLAFFACYSVIQADYKKTVENVFSSWEGIVQTNFSDHFARGNVALLTIKAVRSEPQQQEEELASRMT